MENQGYNISSQYENVVKGGLFVNDDKLLTRSYQVYLERKIHEALCFVGTPIKVIARSKQKEKR